MILSFKIFSTLIFIILLYLSSSYFYEALNFLLDRLVYIEKNDNLRYRNKKKNLSNFFSVIDWQGSLTVKLGTHAPII